MSFKRCVAHATAASGCFVAGHTAYRARLVDKLAGSWGIFIDFIPELGTSRSPEAVLFLFVHTNDFYGGSDSRFPFVDIPAYFSVGVSSDTVQETVYSPGADGVNLNMRSTSPSMT